MERRDILRGAATLPFLTLNTTENLDMSNDKRKRVIKPKRLKQGDTLGVIAPSSSVPDHVVERAIKNLEDLGFKVQLGKNCRNQRGYLAGTDAERLEDLHWAFSDKSIDGIWCIRGGYGATRLLPNIDFKLIKKNPKVFIGYSDITALHVAIFQRTGLVTFHGPVGTSEQTDYTKQHVLNILTNPTYPYKKQEYPNRPKDL